MLPNYTTLHSHFHSVNEEKEKKVPFHALRRCVDNKISFAFFKSISLHIL